MKHRCMVMTLRLSSSCCSGSRQIHHGQKKCVKFAAITSPCWVFFFRHPRLCPQGICIPWSSHQWQVLLWGFEVAEEGHLAQTSRQVEEKQLVSPPWHCARSHITCSTIPDFQKHYSDSPPYSPDLVPCNFFLFPKMKLRLKGRRFDTTEEIPAEMHEVIDTHLRTSGDAWNHGKHAWIAGYMPKGTTSMEKVETRSYGKTLFLWSNSPNF